MDIEEGETVLLGKVYRNWLVRLRCEEVKVIDPRFTL